MNTARLQAMDRAGETNELVFSLLEPRAALTTPSKEPAGAVADQDIKNAFYDWCPYDGKDRTEHMTDQSTTEAFDALMPEPFDHLYEFASPFGGTTLRESASEYNGNRPKRSIALYTADQMREAIRAATERAAKLCDEHGEWYFENHDSQAAQAADACAEAIRGTK